MRDRVDKPTGPPRRASRGGKGGAEPRSVIRGREHQVLTLTEEGWRQEANRGPPRDHPSGGLEDPAPG